MIKLRPYQADLKARIIHLMKKGVKKILLQAPTGAGKGVSIADLVAGASRKGKRCYLFAHRAEIIDQLVLNLAKFNVGCAVVAPGHKFEPDCPVQVISVPSWKGKKDKLPVPDLILFDEAHHASATTWKNIAKEYKDSYLLGFTATPERTDGQGLGDIADEIIIGPTVSELIEMGALCEYRALSIPGINEKKLVKGAKDFTKKSINEALEEIKTGCSWGDYVEHYRKYAEGKQAIVFAPNIEMSKEVAGNFRSAGYSAVHFDGETPKHERSRIINEFRRGKIKVLSNVNLCTEGFDLPILDCLIILRPTSSIILHLQMLGRVLRSHPNKEKAIIIDCVGNLRRLGLPEDARQWSLQGRETRKKKEKEGETTAPIRVCPKCFAAQAARARNCIYCGSPWNLDDQGLKIIDGELVEIGSKKDKENEQKIKNAKKETIKKEQKNCHSLEDFLELGKSLGYSSGWSYHKHKIVTQMRQKYRR